MIKIHADGREDVQRAKTGLWSFDWATYGGIPLGGIYEIYGYSQVGKTSFAYFLSGKVRPDGRILIAEIEGRWSKQYLQSSLVLAGYTGDVYFVPKKWTKGITHEAILNSLVDQILDDERVSAGILDSVGALVTTAQVKGKIGEAFIGKEAKMVWALIRRAVYNLERGRPPTAPPINLYLVNHSHAIIGGKGVVTSGGEGPSYLSTVRIMMGVKEFFSQDGSMVLRGKIKKLTYGPYGRQFRVVLLANAGIHPGLTAMQDCVDLGLGERNKQGMVSVGGAKVGKIGTLLKWAADGKNKFSPFLEVLESYTGSGPSYTKRKRGE